MRAYPFDEFESDVKVLAKRVQAEFVPEVILVEKIALSVMLKTAFCTHLTLRKA